MISNFWFYFAMINRTCSTKPHFKYFPGYGLDLQYWIYHQVNLLRFFWKGTKVISSRIWFIFRPKYILLLIRLILCDIDHMLNISHQRTNQKRDSEWCLLFLTMRSVNVYWIWAWVKFYLWNFNLGCPSLQWMETGVEQKQVRIFSWSTKVRDTVGKLVLNATSVIKKREK